MKQKFINIYVLLCAVISIIIAVFNVQPARFFIDFFAPNIGDVFSLTLVLLLTFLIFFMPLLIFLVLSYLLRTAPDETIPVGKTGIIVARQKALTSALIGIPVYINNKKVGAVDNGKMKFFEIAAGTFVIQAGKGKQASEKIELTIAEKEQLKFDLYINTEGLFPKMELTIIKE